MTLAGLKPCATPVVIERVRATGPHTRATLLTPSEREHRRRDPLQRALDYVEKRARDDGVAVGVRMQAVAPEQRQIAVERGVDVDNRHVLGSAHLLNAIVEESDKPGAVAAPSGG